MTSRLELVLNMTCDLLYMLVMFYEIGYDLMLTTVDVHFFY